MIISPGGSVAANYNRNGKANAALLPPLFKTGEINFYPPAP